MTAAQAAIIDAFNMEVYDPNKMDVQHTPLYDTIALAAAAAVTNITTAFFVNVGPASSKTLASTNMTQQSRLASPEAFSIFGVRIRWSEDILRADLTSIINGFAYKFVLGSQKPYQLGPLWYFSAGGGIWAATTRTAESVYTNGLPSRESMHKLAVPIVIENNMTFSANLEGNSYTLTASASGGTGLTLQCLLDGFYARGVQ